MIKADVLVYLSMLEEAGEVIEQGNELIQRIPLEPPSNIKKYQATLIRLKGRELVMKGDCHKALDILQRSLALYEEIDDKYGIARSSRGIGATTLDNLDQSLEYNRKALKIFKELGNKFHIGWTYTNLDSILVEGSLFTGLLDPKRVITYIFQKNLVSL